MSFWGLANISSSLALNQEAINDYKVNIEIKKDGTIQVTEKIDYSFGDNKRHGIFRTIPVKYKTQKGNYNLRISHIKVTNENGIGYNFTKSYEDDDLKIKIGDADKLVTGEKTYQISYQIKRAINFFDDHDELYWNAIGFQWPVHIKRAIIEVNIPSEGEIQKITCFSGYWGSQQKCQKQEKKGDKAIFQQSNLKPQQGVTVAIGWPKGIVKEPSQWEKFWEMFKDNGIMSLPLIVLIIMLYLWKTRGKDPQGKGTIVAQFEAPDNLSPAEVGTLLDEKADKKDISAELIYLSIKGYLKIKRIEKKGFLGKDIDYELIKLKEADDDLKGYQKKFLKSLFKYKRKSVKLSNLKKSFYEDFQEIRNKVYKDLVEQGYFPKNPQKVRNSFLVTGIIIGFLGIFLGTGSNLWVFSFIIAGAIIVIFAYLMPARTKKGVLAKEHILGLKEYLKVAEKDRINFHNAPKKNPQLFEKLLPYAIVLGVEKEWAKQFEDIYRENSGWYEDNRGSNFNSLILVDSLNSFSTQASSTLASAPSSAAGGGSGFSGGGGGGGFGGGGGGSW